MNTKSDIRLLDTSLGKFYCDTTIDAKTISRLINYHIVTELEKEFIEKFVFPGDTTIDIGAHIGTFTVPFAKKVGPLGFVYAIEPNDVSFDLLNKNVELNGLTLSVKLEQCILSSDSTPRYETEVSDSNHGSLQFRKTKSESSEGPALPSKKLDDIIPKESRKIDVIKIDVEGMEYDVLMGAKSLISRDHPIMYVEINKQALSEQGQTSKNLELFLKKEGYLFFRERSWNYIRKKTYRFVRLPSLRLGGPFYDLIAIHEKSGRLPKQPDTYAYFLGDIVMRQIAKVLRSISFQKQ